MRCHGFTSGQQKQTETHCPRLCLWSRKKSIRSARSSGRVGVKQFRRLCVPDVPTGSVSRPAEDGGGLQVQQSTLIFWWPSDDLLMTFGERSVGDGAAPIDNSQRSLRSSQQRGGPASLLVCVSEPNRTTSSNPVHTNRRNQRRSESGVLLGWPPRDKKALITGLLI